MRQAMNLPMSRAVYIAVVHQLPKILVGHRSFGCLVVVARARGANKDLEDIRAYYTTRPKFVGNEYLVHACTLEAEAPGLTEERNVAAYRPFDRYADPALMGAVVARRKIAPSLTAWIFDPNGEAPIPRIYHVWYEHPCLRVRPQRQFDV